MDDLTECILDRHFTIQLRVIGNVYNNNIKKSDYILSQQWIQHFRQAPGQQKYARNCLMLLMYGQLKEMARLGKPFTDMENSKRNLDDILCEYNGKMDDDDDDNNSNNNRNDVAHNKNDKRDARSNVACHHDGDAVNTKLKNNKPKMIKVISSNKNDVPQDKQKSQLQISEKDHKTQSIPKQIQTFELQKIESKNQKLMTNIWQSVLQAINRLKTWTGPDDQINFISICLQHFLTPDMKDNIAILDRRFERMLNSIAQHACERHEKNVMILFEQLSKQQHKLFLANKEYNRRLENYAMNPQNCPQKTHKDFLKEREQLLWQQEAIANGVSALVACNHYSNQHSFNLEGGSKHKYQIETKDVKQNDESIISYSHGQQTKCNIHSSVGKSHEKKGSCSCQGPRP